MNKQHSRPSFSQQGIAFWHILLLVLIAVTVAVCAKKNSLPVIQQPISNISLPSLPKFSGFSSANSSQSTAPVSDSKAISSYTDNTVNARTMDNSPEQVEWLLASDKTRRVTQPPPNSAYELQYPRNVANGYYTVQVFAGYNSKHAYDLQRALKRDGYRAYVHEERKNNAILFKVRVGKYSNRSNAFAMNTKIRLSYPARMGKSFVLLRQ